jgi:hypothetical protein
MRRKKNVKKHKKKTELLIGIRYILVKVHIIKQNESTIYDRIALILRKHVKIIVEKKIEEDTCKGEKNIK